MDPLAVLVKFWPNLLAGLGMTLTLAGLGALIAGAIALPLAILRHGGGGIIEWPMRLYISFIRGTPLLGQLFLVYYGSGQFRPQLDAIGLWSFFREPFNCALLTFVLNSVAYQIEIMRGGLQGVPGGQVEAARAIGMSGAMTYWRVILPHAYRIALPALGNEVILLMKGSAVASVITIFDLMGETRAIFAKTFDFSVYLWAAVLYLIITTIFVRGWIIIETLLNPHLKGHRELIVQPIPGMR